MKIKFEWEVINEKRGGDVSDVTLRAKTIGGWVVKSVYVEGGEFNCKSIREHALIFVPDSEHLWEV